MSRRTACWLGASACAISASLATPLLNDSPARRLVPFLFLLVIVFVATRFGRLAGILGTIAAALIFSIFLFKPTPSLLIEDPAARSHLIWMLLIGIILSDLLGAYIVPGSHKKL